MSEKSSCECKDKNPARYKLFDLEGQTGDMVKRFLIMVASDGVNRGFGNIDQWNVVSDLIAVLVDRMLLFPIIRRWNEQELMWCSVINPYLSGLLSLYIGRCVATGKLRNISVINRDLRDQFNYSMYIGGFNVLRFWCSLTADAPSREWANVIL